MGTSRLALFHIHWKEVAIYFSLARLKDRKNTLQEGVSGGKVIFSLSLIYESLLPAANRLIDMKVAF